jgi:hypothetical protein
VFANTAPAHMTRTCKIAANEATVAEDRRSRPDGVREPGLKAALVATRGVAATALTPLTIDGQGLCRFAAALGEVAAGG